MSKIDFVYAFHDERQVCFALKNGTNILVSKAQLFTPELEKTMYPGGNGGYLFPHNRTAVASFMKSIGQEKVNEEMETNDGGKKRLAEANVHPVTPFKRPRQVLAPIVMSSQRTEITAPIVMSQAPEQAPESDAIGLAAPPTPADGKENAGPDQSYEIISD